MTEASADDAQSRPTVSVEHPVGRSTELVLPGAPIGVPAPGSARRTALELRGRLPELARHPAAVASASAAATIGAGFVLNAVRRAFVGKALGGSRGADRVVIGALVVQQVQVVQHVVHREVN